MVTFDQWFMLCMQKWSRERQYQRFGQFLVNEMPPGFIGRISPEIDPWEDDALVGDFLDWLRGRWWEYGDT